MMSKTTGIAWTRSTRGFWTGCTKIGPGCDHCYAERFAKFAYGGRNWGPGAPRTPHLEGAARDLRRWNKQAGLEQAWSSEPWRVFINSQSDIFDNEVPAEWRTFAFETMRECQNLQFILVTKRIGNAARMLPADWGDGYPNVVLLITVCNQEEADRDVPKLLATPARWRGLSVEPQLCFIDVGPYLKRDRMFSMLPGFRDPMGGLDWVIVGGESGVGQARPFDLAWAYHIVSQCRITSTACFVKQIGAHPVWRGARVPINDKAGGDPMEWPADLRVREFPRP